MKNITKAMICGILITSVIMCGCAYSENVQGGIAKEVIRFHVLANSDEYEDQELKMIVRDGILDLLSGTLDMCKTVSETRIALTENLEAIETAAREIIAANGYNYDVRAELTTEMFPTRIYDGAAFPAGKYEALRISIGEGSGKNWWCMMFPPLCFIDATQPKMENSSKDKLKNILTDEELGVVLNSGNNQGYKAKFFVVETFQKIKNRIMG